MVLKAEAVGIGNTSGTTTVAVKMLKGAISRLFHSKQLKDPHYGAHPDNGKVIPICGPLKS